MSNRYTLCIDTEQYSGNFERELTAWITGQIGECTVGDREAKVANRELPQEARTWFDNHVLQVPDEHGCHRPTKIQPTPGWLNDGHGNHYRDTEDRSSPERLAACVASVEMYYAPHIKNAEQQIAEGNKAWERDLARYEASVAEAKALTKVGAYPAYQSVGIFLDSPPPPEIIQLVKDRAATFNGRPGQSKWERINPITVTGFRLVEEKTTAVSESI